MIEVTISDLESRSINSLIDDNIRFQIITDEEFEKEEEKVNAVADKVALLREQCNRLSK